MPCRRLYAHERSLVKKLQGKPFVLVGVNSDEDREAAQQTVKDHGLTWRSWWDGMNGPLAKRWGVSGWPAFYVLDARGIVRHRLNDVEEVERAVEGLLAELR
jgi:hypothetical protein